MVWLRALMAVDTENRRRSVQAYTLGLMRPLADGTIGALDRATVAWFYSGLTYASPVVDEDLPLYHQTNRRSVIGIHLRR